MPDKVALVDGEILLGPSQDLLLAVPGQAGPGVADGGDEHHGIITGRKVVSLAGSW